MAVCVSIPQLAVWGAKACAAEVPCHSPSVSNHKHQRPIRFLAVLFVHSNICVPLRPPNYPRQSGEEFRGVTWSQFPQLPEPDSRVPRTRLRRDELPGSLPQLWGSLPNLGRAAGAGVVPWGAALKRPMRCLLWGDPWEMRRWVVRSLGHANSLTHRWQACFTRNGRCISMCRFRLPRVANARLHVRQYGEGAFLAGLGQSGALLKCIGAGTCASRSPEECCGRESQTRNMSEDEWEPPTPPVCFRYPATRAARVSVTDVAPVTSCRPKN